MSSSSSFVKNFATHISNDDGTSPLRCKAWMRNDVVVLRQLVVSFKSLKCSSKSMLIDNCKYLELQGSLINPQNKPTKPCSRFWHALSGWEAYSKARPDKLILQTFPILRGFHIYICRKIKRLNAAPQS